jgi:hypothetical protein
VEKFPVPRFNNLLEGQLWKLIIERYGHDEDTYIFLEEMRRYGLMAWISAKARRIESDINFLVETKGQNIWPETIKDAAMLCKVCELLQNYEVKLDIEEIASTRNRPGLQEKKGIEGR